MKRENRTSQSRGLQSVSPCSGVLSVLAASIAVLGAAPAVAEPMLQYASLYRNADMSRWTDNYVELGAGYNSKDSYKFGEWSGLREMGAYPIVGFNWLSRERGNDANYWAIHGADLGLETRKLSLEGGQQGRWNLAFDASRLVRSELDSARFVHQGLGSNSLTLPTGFTRVANATLVPASRFSGYNIEQGRDFYKLSLRSSLSSDWGFDISYREDVRDGTRLTGIPFNQALVVPYAIDDRTQQVESLLSYASKVAQFQLGYTYSRFDNKLDAFTVANPFSAGATLGRMSLMPGNEFHQLTATGAYAFTNATRLTTKLSYGIGTQDETFLPYTTGTATIRALPRSSLDGEVIKTLFDATLTTRPSDKSTLKLGYQYYDYDNRTPIAQYLYASRDTNQAAPAATGSANLRSNAPISTTENKVLLDGDYMIAAQTLLRGFVEYKQVEYALTDRAETETTKAGVELRKPVMDNFLGSVGYTYTERTGTAYDKNTFFRNSYTDPNLQANTTGGSLTNHPSMRAFIYSDYDENRLRASGNWTISETVSLQTSVDGYQQAFSDPDCSNIADPRVAAAINKNQTVVSSKLPNTCLGRTLAEGGSLNLDLQWQPEENLSTFAFFNIAETVVEQAGRTWRLDDGTTALPADESATAADQRRNWFGKLTNQDHSVGLGAKWQPKETWDLGGQYVFSHGVSKTAVNQAAAPSVGGGNAGSILAATALPDAETTVHTVQLYAKWNYNRKTTIRLNYLYETLRSTNWAYDGLTPTSATGVLLTGQTSPKYENHVIGVSVAMHSW